MLAAKKRKHLGKVHLHWHKNWTKKLFVAIIQYMSGRMESRRSIPRRFSRAESIGWNQYRNGWSTEFKRIVFEAEEAIRESPRDNSNKVKHFVAVWKSFLERATYFPSLTPDQIRNSLAVAHVDPTGKDERNIIVEVYREAEKLQATTMQDTDLQPNRFISSPPEYTDHPLSGFVRSGEPSPTAPVIAVVDFTNKPSAFRNQVGGSSLLLPDDQRPRYIGPFKFIDTLEADIAANEPLIRNIIFYQHGEQVGDEKAQHLSEQDKEVLEQNGIVVTSAFPPRTYIPRGARVQEKGVDGRGAVSIGYTNKKFTAEIRKSCPHLQEATFYTCLSGKLGATLLQEHPTMQNVIVYNHILPPWLAQVAEQILSPAMMVAAQSGMPATEAFQIAMEGLQKITTKILSSSGLAEEIAQENAEKLLDNFLLLSK